MKKILALGAFIFVFVTIPAFAQTFALKVGIIDMNQILQKSSYMLSINADLLKSFQPRQASLSDAQKSLQEETNNFNLNNSTMSSGDRAKMQNKIIEDQANVQVLTANLQRDLTIAKDEALRKFMMKFNSVISKIAQDGRYDFIEQNTNFAFVKAEYDITAEVLKQL